MFLIIDDLCTFSVIYVLYGSQTGNSEDIAKDLHLKLEESGAMSVCDTLNNSKKLPINQNGTAMFIICSTTGNGDCPENADQWWRTVKLRSAVRLTSCTCKVPIH